jgi:hypothetical protein
MYSKEAKRYCIDLVNNNQIPVEIVSTISKVPLKSLKRWLQIGWKRQPGCGRKIKDPMMEENLINWYHNCLLNGLQPTASTIRKKALELTTSEDFMASKGWLEKFKRKYNITTYTRKDIQLLKKC